MKFGDLLALKVYTIRTQGIRTDENSGLPCPPPKKANARSTNAVCALKVRRYEILSHAKFSATIRPTSPGLLINLMCLIAIKAQN